MFFFVTAEQLFVFFHHSFCPTDSKYASCSDDGTVRVWDFLHCHEERVLRGMFIDCFLMTFKTDFYTTTVSFTLTGQMKIT